MSKELEALKELRYRITNFNGKFNDYSKIINTIEQALKEHEQYKAIEQELGIDLMTLFKALKGLIYKPTYKEMIKYCGGRYPRYAEGFCLRYNEPTNRYFLEVGSPISDVWQVLELKDYGKNWALTKKELEK